MAAMAPRVLVGTCNWADHAPFYPKGLAPTERLGHYAALFPIVEVDSSFYGIPSPRSTQRWAETTPDDFVFNVKAHRSMTGHERVDGLPRPPTAGELTAFEAALAPLRASGKLRAIHYQFPPWFTASAPNLARLAELPERHPDDRIAVEFRHRSFGEPERWAQVSELLAEARLTYCCVDEPQIGSGSMPPVRAVTTPELAMVRFHGRNRQTWYRGGPRSGDRFDYRYRPEELGEWLGPIREIGDQAQEVHLLFNNNQQNYAVLNALELAALLGLARPRLGADRPPGQPELPLAVDARDP